MYEAAKTQDAFTTTPEGLRETLQQYGVAIVPNVLDDKDIKQMQKGFWKMLEQMSASCSMPIKKSNRKTWDTFYKFKPLRGMLLQHWGIGQAQVLWDLRQNPKIVDTFATFWGVPREELLVSFDGASFAFPHEATKRGNFDGTIKFHIDQAPNDPAFRCVQSWVTAYDVNSGDATLSILEGSHTMLEDFCKAFHKEHVSRDFCILTPDELAWYMERGCVVRDVTCPAGSMVFWDSRSVHYGKGALPDRPKRNFRAVSYLCYTPKELATEESLEGKREAFIKKKTTTHCPHDPKLFPNMPRWCKTMKPEDVNLPIPVLTPLGRSLAGFEVLEEEP